jgi:hypothetical protein
MSFTLLYQSLIDWTTTFTLTDVTEIGFISLCCFILMRWLARDAAPLLEFLCLYAASAACAWCFNLSALTYLFWYCSPIAIIVLMFAHHHTLQKHYITWRNSGRSFISNTPWPEALIKLTLRAWNKQVSMIWIIERQDSLHPFLASAGELHAPLTPHLMEILLAQTAAHEQLSLWLNVSGTVVAHNPHGAQLKTVSPPELSSFPEMVRTLIMTSSSHDGIVLCGDARLRNYTIIAQGTYQKNLTSQQALHAMQKLITRTEDVPCTKSPGPSSEQFMHKQSGHAASDHSYGQ